MHRVKDKNIVQKLRWRASSALDGLRKDDVTMKKIVNKRTYNTNTATKIGTYCEGQFGDPAGYEESLYKTKKGQYFLHGIGGAESKYPEEDLVPVTKEEANAWYSAHVE